MSFAAIDAVLSDRSTSGVYRLAMLAMAECGGNATASSVQRWVNCDEASAHSLLDEMVQTGLLDEEYDDEEGCVRYFSGWLYRLTYGASLSRQERSRYIPKAVRIAVFERDQDTCQYCGITGVEMHIDHVQPFSRGGSNDIENLKLACAPCNISKRDKTLEEWGGRHEQ